MLLVAAAWQRKASALSLPAVRAGMAAEPGSRFAVLTGSGVLDHEPGLDGLVRFRVGPVEQWERKLLALDQALEAHDVERVDLLVPAEQLDMVRVLAQIRLQHAESLGGGQLMLRGRVPLRFHGVADLEDVELALADLHESPESDEERVAKLARARRARRGAQIRGEDTEELDREIEVLQRQLVEGDGLEAGALLGEGRFELLEEVGEGGFAKVWRAYDHLRQEIVAVRLLHRRWSQDRTRVELFFNGARQMSRLRHPNIGAIFVEEGRERRDHYFVMEYFTGGDLREAVRTGRAQGPAALRAIHQVSLGLSHAHANGVVHGDIKPSNILLNADGVAVLTDFDLARITTTSDGTRTAAMGSFVFCAPEVLEGRRAPDTRSDVYSLAATTVFVLGGSEVSTLSLLRDAEGACEALACPQALRDVLVRCLSIEPAERMADAEAFARSLDGILSRPWKTARPMRRRRALRRAVRAVALVAGLASLTVGAVSVQERAGDPTAEVLRLRERALELASTDGSASLALLRAATSLWLKGERRGLAPLDAPTLQRMARESGMSHVINAGSTVLEALWVPELSRLVTGHSDGSITLWDLETGEAALRVQTGLHWVTDLEPLAESGRLLAWDRKDLKGRRLLQFIDLERGQVYRTIPSQGFISDVQLSEDRRWLHVMESNAEPTRLIAVSDDIPPRLVPRGAGLLGARAVERGGELFLDWLGVTGEVRRLSSTSAPEFDLDLQYALAKFQGPYVLLGGAQRARLWDARVGALVAEFPAPAERTLELSPDARFVALVGEAGDEGQLWRTHPTERVAFLDGHALGLGDVGFSADSQQLVTASLDGLVQVWSTTHGQRHQRLVGHGGAVHAAEFVQLGAREAVLTAGQGGELRIWSSTWIPDNLLHTSKLQVRGEDFVVETPDGRMVQRDGAGQVKIIGPEPDQVTVVASWPDVTMHAVASCDRLYAVTDAGALWSVDIPPGGCDTRARVADEGYTVLSPDASLLARLSMNGLSIWSTASGERIVSSAESRMSAGPIRFSADGRLLWVAKKSGAVEGLDPRTGVVMQRLDDGDAWASRLVDTRDGRYLLVPTWDEDGRVIVWDTQTGDVVRRLEQHEAQVTSLVLSPDERRFATASWDHSARVYDLESGEELFRFTEQGGDVTRLAFSADGETLVTGSKDGTCRLWDLDTGASKGVLAQHEAAIGALRFVDDERIRVTDSHGVSGVWGIPIVPTTEALLDQAGALTNLRVCRSGHEVVSVVPFPAPETIWAPAELCAPEDVDLSLSSTALSKAD